METTVWFADKNEDHSHHSHHLVNLICASQPTLTFSPFHTDQSWHSDIFILFHNPIRHELQHLFSMLRSAAFRIEALRISDCLALQKCIMQFSQITSLYFHAQQRVIYPAIHAKNPHISSIECLQHTTKPLLNALIAVHARSLALTSACRAQVYDREQSHVRRVHEQLTQLSALVSAFVADIQRLFDDEMAHLVPVVRRFSNKFEARHLEKDALLLIIDKSQPDDTFAAYSRWLPPHVKRHYFDDAAKITLSKLQSRERKWAKNHNALHMHFANGV